MLTSLSSTPLRVGACLSLSGRYERFGRQAANGLAVWRELDGQAELVIEDDASDADRLAEVLPSVARRCDLLLGPYSTHLTRRAAALAAEGGDLLWNHGGAGDDVQTRHPRHVVSMLTPASRYARPYLRLLSEVAHDGAPAPLRIVGGRGRFGNLVATGARDEAVLLQLAPGLFQRATALPDSAEPWDLLLAGAFEEDVAALTAVKMMARPPRLVCAIAAGVSDFQATPAFAPGVYGISQWMPGTVGSADVGPDEATFIARYRELSGVPPDYPAVQAAAAAALAAHCARRVGATTRDALWPAATGFHGSTLFGRFKVDAASGAQVGHETRLVRWTDAGLMEEVVRQPPAGSR